MSIHDIESTDVRTSRMFLVAPAAAGVFQYALDPFVSLITGPEYE